MMSSKLYHLLVILSIFVICSICAEQKPRQRDSALDYKRKASGQDKDDDHYQDTDEYADVYDDNDDNNRSPSTSYAHNRYSSYNPGDANYRSRSRGSSSSPLSALDDYMNGDDWHRSGHRNSYSGSSSSSPYDNSAMLSNGPSCHSLIDPQYAIFSDMCGAVPQARYSLPNLFGHRERWQMAQVLTTLMSSSNDANCIRSLRLLLCPVLFPPCQTRHEPPPVLPCKSYCRAVKAQCAIPALDLLPCEVLPHSSDLCPINHAYGSFIPTGGFPSVPPPLIMPGGLPPTNFPPTNFPPTQSFSSLHSLLSSQGLPTAFTPPAPSNPFATPVHSHSLTPTHIPSIPMSSSVHAAQAASPLNLYGGAPFTTDSLTSMYNEYPSNAFTNDYRQSLMYGPLTRSSTESRPTNDMRPTNDIRPSTDIRTTSDQRTTPDPRNSIISRASMVKA